MRITTPTTRAMNHKRSGICFHADFLISVPHVWQNLVRSVPHVWQNLFWPVFRFFVDADFAQVGQSATLQLGCFIIFLQTPFSDLCTWR